MPMSAPRRCRGCKRLVRGRCDQCDQSWTRKPKSWKNGSTRSWRTVRDLRLTLDPLCTWPNCEDVADQVDHIDGTDYTDDTGTGASWLNVEMTRSLCTPHHRTRTARQGNEAQTR